MYDNNSNFQNRPRTTSSGGDQRQGSAQNRGNLNQGTRDSANNFFANLRFKPEWISIGADEEMVKFAEDVGKYMAPLNKYDKQALTKSQIRNVFGEIKRINLKGFDTTEGKSSFMLLKPKVAYAEGRNKTMGLSLFKIIFDVSWKYVVDKKSYQNFCNLIESILAYHKAFGGKD